MAEIDPVRDGEAHTKNGRGEILVFFLFLSNYQGSFGDLFSSFM